MKAAKIVFQVISCTFIGYTLSIPEYKAVFAKKKSNDPLNKMMPMEYGSSRGSGGGFGRGGGGGGDWGICLIKT